MPAEFYGSPTAGQLVEAVREFLESLGGDVAPERAYHLRVAVNALRVVERELAAGAEAEPGHQRRLSALGVSGDLDLARAIRSGQLPASRRDELLASVLADVEERLRVASPGYMANYEPGQ
jgi:hypothetical protein